MILNISTYTPEPGKIYLFDSNAWLCILHPYYLKDHKKKYLQFFNNIKRSALKPKPRIALPAVLLSEIINRLIRDVYYQEFKLDNPRLLTETSESKNFKKIYRNHNQYRIDYDLLCYEIKLHHSTVDFVEDNFSEYKFKDILKAPPTGLDFNDFLYCKITEKKNLILVTDDIDFSIGNVNVITGNNKLLNPNAT